MAIIEVNHVNKEFRLGKVVGIRQTMRNAFNRLRGRSVADRPLFKALDDVTFGVDQGEVVGIIGQNGAGKSTLLKILSRVTTPSSGSAQVRGKVAPLIEVGAGLNPELTGRENVFLNAGILGIPRAEIKRKFDEIVSFAGLEEFIDTPIKRYSSGMKVRLGFAIATSINAEILIVDEVLAVGDLAFQRKCFDRMEDLIKGRGNTVLLVSHNIRQVERLCSRVILLDHGRVAMDGPPAEVCNRFYAQSNDKIHRTLETEHAARRRERTSGEVEVEAIEVLDARGEAVDRIVTREPLHVRIRLRLKNPIAKPEFHVGTHTTDFVYLTTNSSAVVDDRPDLDTGVHTIECRIPSYPLKPGVYCLRLAVLDQFRRLVYHGETLTLFSVLPEADEGRQAMMRLFDVDADWTMDGRRFEPAPKASPEERCPVAVHAVQ